MNSPDFEQLLPDSLEIAAEEYCYTYEQAARIATVSVTLIERFVSLNLIETEDARLRERDLARITQMLRLRRDLGLNWVGTGMVLDLSQEVARLKARLRAYESGSVANT